MRSAFPSINMCFGAYALTYRRSSSSKEASRSRSARLSSVSRPLRFGIFISSVEGGRSGLIGFSPESVEMPALRLGPRVPSVDRPLVISSPALILRNTWSPSAGIKGITLLEFPNGLF